MFRRIIRGYRHIAGDPSVRHYFLQLLLQGRWFLGFRSLMDLFSSSQIQPLPDELQRDFSLAIRSDWAETTDFPRLLPLVRLTGQEGQWTGVRLPATMVYCARDELPWSQSFQDPEDTMGLHRFSWVLQQLPRLKRVPWDVIEDWLIWAEENPSSPEMMNSYTVSERLCNLITLSVMDQPSEDVSTRLVRRVVKDGRFLLSHLEYYGVERTNNHILNNARALAFSAAWLKQQDVLIFAVSLMKQQLPLHCDHDGVLREGSSHYQWVISRWVVEVTLLLKQIRQQNSALGVWSTRLLNACDHLSLGCLDEQYMPLIGDVSPDFSPPWLAGMTACARTVLQQPVSTAGSWHARVNGGWVGLFGHKPVVGRFSRGGWQSVMGHWFGFRKHQWSVLGHNRQYVDVRDSHAHQDEFSFELAYRGVPVIVDVGRKNYVAGGSSAQAAVVDEWHNSVLINGQRLSFRPRYFMSADWLVTHLTQAILNVGLNKISLSLDHPKQVEHLELFERRWYYDDNKLKIETHAVFDKAATLTFWLVLNTQRLLPYGENCLLLEVDRKLLKLEWSGMSAPDVEESDCYPYYGYAEPCKRLRWSVKCHPGQWLGEWWLSDA
jgi:hypothetical protein